MTTFFSKIRTGLKKMFLFLKGNILVIIFILVIIYQNSRIDELEKDLGEGFAFESTTDIVDRLADEVENLKSRADDIESNTDDASSLSSDVDSKVSDLEGRIDDMESSIDDIETNIWNMDSDIRRLKWDL